MFSFYSIFLYSFCCFTTFIIIFNIRAHFLFSADELSNCYTRSLVFELTYNFFDCFMKIWRIFGVVAIVNSRDEEDLVWLD